MIAGPAYHEFVDALEPHWTGYHTQHVPGFGSYLASRSDVVSLLVCRLSTRGSATGNDLLKIGDVWQASVRLPICIQRLR